MDTTITAAAINVVKAFVSQEKAARNAFGKAEGLRIEMYVACLPLLNAEGKGAKAVWVTLEKATNIADVMQSDTFVSNVGRVFAIHAVKGDDTVAFIKANGSSPQKAKAALEGKVAAAPAAKAVVVKDKVAAALAIVQSMSADELARFVSALTAVKKTA